MKKWLAILVTVFVSGFIISAILAGRVYYEDLQTYEDYDKKQLSLQSSQNIYIQSTVPIEVHSTKETPYVEFKQKFVDLVGVAPHYELSVENKGNNTYISLEQIDEIFLKLGIKENKAKLIIYLPEGDLNHLSIQNEEYGSFTKDSQVINLEQINIKELDINLRNVDLNLNGAYERVDISGHCGKININSTTPMQFYSDGYFKQYLSGKFDKIMIKNNSDDITIESKQACDVEIENNDSNLRLTGLYSKIKVKGSDNDMDLRSETECKLITEGMENRISANGAFKFMSLEEEHSEADIQTTVIPEGIQLLDEAQDTSLSLTLPSNIPGITLKYMSDEEEISEYDEELYREYSYLDESNKRLQSDFLLVEQDKKLGKSVYKYGNGEVPILINNESGISLELIDGGYSSTVNK